MYICVCVCVCVCFHGNIPMDNKAKVKVRDSFHLSNQSNRLLIFLYACLASRVISRLNCVKKKLCRFYKQLIYIH